MRCELCGFREERDCRWVYMLVEGTTLFGGEKGKELAAIRKGQRVGIREQRNAKGKANLQKGLGSGKNKEGGRGGGGINKQFGGWGREISLGQIISTEGSKGELRRGSTSIQKGEKTTIPEMRLII